VSTRLSRSGPRLALAVLAIALAACGVPTSGAPRAIGKSALPIPPPSTTTTAPIDGVQVTIVLLSAATSAPTPVHRVVALKDDNLRSVLSDLLSGPQPGETLQGLTTAIPTSTQLFGVDPNPLGTPGKTPSTPIVINLSTDFLEINGPNVVLAIEQVVFTVACDLSATARVSFEVDGDPQDVPIAIGTSVSRPVTAADYLATGTGLDCNVSVNG
jgi:hypothetical protein